MDRRIPPPTRHPGAMSVERQRQMQAIQMEKIRRKRRKRFIRKCILLSCTVVILAFIIFLVVSLVNLAVNAIEDYNYNKIRNSVEYNTPVLVYIPEPEEPEIVIRTEPEEPYPGGVYIDYYYAADQVLPQTYSTENYHFYKNWDDDNPLMTLDNGITIVIDAGHQIGTRKSDVWLSPYIDPDDSDSWVYNSLLKIGATGVVTGVNEYVVTHTIADKLKKALEAEGYTVILSHPDVTAQISGAERAAVANKNDADLMISLHCDAFNDPTVTGCGSWVPAIWEGYPSERLAYLSYAAGEHLVNEYAAATGMNNRGCKTQSLTSMFSFCKVPIVLFEMGYMSNKSDDKNLTNEAFQEKVVQGLVNGINKYFELLWD